MLTEADRRLHPVQLLDFSMPLPDISEQTRIVEQFSAAAAAIGEHHATVEFVEGELRAALAKAFSIVVQGAPRVRMGDVAPLLRRSVQIEAAERYTELGVRSFYKGTFHRRTLGGEEFTWQNLFRVRAGDLIFSNLMAWEQGIAVATDADDNCVGNHRMLTCEVDRSRSTPQFLLYYFKTPEGFSKVLGASPGSIARNKTLSAEELPRIEVPMPPLSAQKWFDELQAKAALAGKWSGEAASELNQVVPALLHQIF
jgi:restriction endonuclease S subunit